MMVRRRQRRSTYLRIASVLMVGAPVAVGGGGGDDDDGTADSEAVTIRWFVGLGTGSEPEQQDRQQAIVEEFNETHDDGQLEIEIVDNAVAAETLATQIAPRALPRAGQPGPGRVAHRHVDPDRRVRLRPALLHARHRHQRQPQLAGARAIPEPTQGHSRW
ncbi:MAG: hypothetical protein ACRD0A_06075 [Acidimicrobiales bacterium]